jgi:hypothetical protein
VWRKVSGAIYWRGREAFDSDWGVVMGLSGHGVGFDVRPTVLRLVYAHRGIAATAAQARRLHRCVGQTEIESFPPLGPS